MHKVYLSRRNIQSLINKLDRVKTGEYSACTLIKRDNLHAKYPQTMESCSVTSVEGTISQPAPAPSDEQHIYLTRENLIGLLDVLNSTGNAADGKSGVGMVYGGFLEIYALEDKEYYETRSPGEVFHADDPGVRM